MSLPAPWTVHFPFATAVAPSMAGELTSSDRQPEGRPFVVTFGCCTGGGLDGGGCPGGGLLGGGLDGGGLLGGGGVGAVQFRVTVMFQLKKWPPVLCTRIAWTPFVSRTTPPSQPPVPASWTSLPSTINEALPPVEVAADTV